MGVATSRTQSVCSVDVQDKLQFQAESKRLPATVFDAIKDQEQDKKDDLAGKGKSETPPKGRKRARSLPSDKLESFESNKRPRLEPSRKRARSMDSEPTTKPPLAPRRKRPRLSRLSTEL